MIFRKTTHERASAAYTIPRCSPRRQASTFKARVINEVALGRTVRLDTGVAIQFGTTDGEIVLNRPDPMVAKSPPLKDHVRQRLHDVVASSGQDSGKLYKLCTDPRLFRALLIDFCPGTEFRRERELLVAVVECRGAAELYSSRNGDLDRAPLRRLIAQMVSDYGYSEESVRWAVYSWIDAQG